MKAATLDALPDVFLTCRTVGHAWEPQVTYAETHGRRSVYRAVWVCGREARAGVPDPSEKEVLSYTRGRARGSLAEVPRFTYADGYLVDEHLGRGRQRPAARALLMDRLATRPALRAVRKETG